MVSVEQFDEWYTAMSTHPVARDDVVHRHLGLPLAIRSTSLLGMPGLLEVRDLLQLTPQDLLLDLACGRGGYGLWLAGDAGARLIGVDFSPVAIELAKENVAAFDLPPQLVEFRVGALEASGLSDGCADALVCIDAVQFADDIICAASEFCRVVRSGGSVVVTCWEALDGGNARLPERIRRVHLATQLAAGGLAEVHVFERPDWHEMERGLWIEAVGLDPGDDLARQALEAEAARVLPTLDEVRRVLASAVVPVR